jgi:hypothetical protein
LKIQFVRKDYGKKQEEDMDKEKEKEKETS